MKPSQTLRWLLCAILAPPLLVCYALFLVTLCALTGLVLLRAKLRGGEPESVEWFPKEVT